MQMTRVLYRIETHLEAHICHCNPQLFISCTHSFLLIRIHYFGYDAVWPLQEAASYGRGPAAASSFHSSSIGQSALLAWGRLICNLVCHNTCDSPASAALNQNRKSVLSILLRLFDHPRG